MTSDLETPLTPTPGETSCHTPCDARRSQRVRPSKSPSKGILKARRNRDEQRLPAPPPPPPIALHAAPPPHMPPMALTQMPQTQMPQTQMPQTQMPQTQMPHMVPPPVLAHKSEPIQLVLPIPPLVPDKFSREERAYLASLADHERAHLMNQLDAVKVPDVPLRFRVLASDLPGKDTILQRMRTDDHPKFKQWIETALSVPFGKYRESATTDVPTLLRTASDVLDAELYGQLGLKDEILRALRLRNLQGDFARPRITRAARGGENFYRTRARPRDGTPCLLHWAWRDARRCDATWPLLHLRGQRSRSSS